MPLLEEKVDRLENHFKVYKSDLTDVKEVTRDIRNLLTGTELTGKKGVVHLLETLEKKVDTLEEKQLLIDQNMNNIKFATQTVFTAVVGFFIWLFTSK